MARARLLTWTAAAGTYACMLYLSGARWPVYAPLVLVYLPGSLPFVVACAASTAAGAVAALLLRPGIGTAGLALTISLSLQAIACLVFALRGRLIDSGFREAPAESPLARWRETPRLAQCWAGLYSAVFLGLYSFPLAASASMVVLLFAVRRVLRVPGPGRSWGRRAGAALGGFVAILVVAAIVEAGARIVFPNALSTSRMFESHAEYLFDLRPGVDIKFEVPVGDGGKTVIEARISKQGMREREIGPKAPGEFRILLAGDSFTFGQAVDAGQTISALLERQLRSGDPGRDVTAINFGIPATGPWQQLGLYLERGAALQPDLVVHQVFLGNDIHDALTEVNLVPRAIDPTWKTQLTYLRFHNYGRFAAEIWLAENSHAYYALRRVVKVRNIALFLASDLRFLPRVEMPDYRGLVRRPPAWEVNLADWYPEIETAYDRMLDSIEQFRDACARDGIGYVVYCVPQNEEVVPRLFDERAAQIDPPAAYVPLKGIRVLEQRLGARGIPYVDVVGPLREHPDPESLYYERDGHTTPAGNRVIADTLERFLQRDYFSVHPLPPAR